MEPAKILVTGATGYIGGRLVPYLLKKGYALRVLVRDILRQSGEVVFCFLQLFFDLRELLSHRIRVALFSLALFTGNNDTA